jgi:Mg-chelatase subunit ChlD
MSEGETIMVCDLGGGTYDATILALKNGTFIPLATMGDRELGGHDWTMILVELVAERFFAKVGEDPRNDLFAGQKLYEDCEKAKRDFARLEHIDIPCQYQGRLENILVSRADFESATEHRIQTMILHTENAVTKAGLSWANIDRILLVGGSSRLRRMAESLQHVSGKTPVQTAEPDLMVALGAAILARGQVKPRRAAGGLTALPKGGLVDISFKRVITRSLGTRVITFSAKKAEIRNSLIIAHGTESPVSCVRDDYQISFKGQPHFDLPVVEFEDEDDFDQISNYRFHCPPGAARGDLISVTFHYDESGIITVSASDVKTGKSLTHERIAYEEPDIDAITLVVAKPRWVVFAVDVSGSMDGSKMANARQGLIENARLLLADGGDEVRVGVVSFNARAAAVCRPTADLAQVERAASSLDASGTTNMGEGLQFAFDMLGGAPPDADRDIVMLTDGHPDDRDTALSMAGRVTSGGITLSAIGVGSHDVDQGFLARISPNPLVIDRPDDIGGAMTTLLTQAAEKRSDGGLRTT